MGLREELAREAHVLREGGSLQIVGLDRGLVIRELAHEEMVPFDLRPAEEGIAQRLHAVLRLGDALTLLRHMAGPL
jgi:hypothetical protein